MFLCFYVDFKQFVIAVDSYAATNPLWLWTTLQSCCNLRYFTY